MSPKVSQSSSSWKRALYWLGCWDSLRWFKWIRSGSSSSVLLRGISESPQWGCCSDFGIVLTYSNLGAAYLCLFPGIQLLTWFCQIGIIHVKHEPNFFPTFNPSFSIWIPVGSTGSKSFTASWQGPSAFKSQSVIILNPYGSLFPVCQSSVSA